MSVLHEMLERGRRNRERAKSRRHKGRKPVYQLDGKMMSLREIARELGVSKQAIQWQMKRRGWTLEDVAAHYRRKRGDDEYRNDDAAQKMQAVDKIMKIITEG